MTPKISLKNVARRKRLKEQRMRNANKVLDAMHEYFWRDAAQSGMAFHNVSLEDVFANRV